MKKLVYSILICLLVTLFLGGTHYVYGALGKKNTISKIYVPLDHGIVSLEDGEILLEPNINYDIKVPFWWKDYKYAIVYNFANRSTVLFDVINKKHIKIPEARHLVSTAHPEYFYDIKKDAIYYAKDNIWIYPKCSNVFISIDGHALCYKGESGSTYLELDPTDPFEGYKVISSFAKPKQVQLQTRYKKGKKPESFLFVSSDNNYQVYNTNLVKIYSGEFRALNILGGFSNGDIRAVTLDGKVGYMSDFGQWLIPPKYENVKLPGVSDFKVLVAQSNGKWGYIDREGNMIIPFIYDRADNFDHNDYAFVEIDGKVGVIKTNGEYLITPRDGEYGLVFKDKVLWKKGEKWGILSKDLKWFTEPNHYVLPSYYVSDDFYFLNFASEYIITEDWKKITCEQ